jgi:Tfp pilus assembly protein PilN
MMEGTEHLAERHGVMQPLYTLVCVRFRRGIVNREQESGQYLKQEQRKGYSAQAKEIIESRRQRPVNDPSMPPRQPETDIDIVE